MDKTHFFPTKLVSLRKKALNFSFSNKVKQNNSTKLHIPLNKLLLRERTLSNIKRRLNTSNSILNVSNSFESNSSSVSNSSIKRVNSKGMSSEEKDILDKIEIKETNENGYNKECLNQILKRSESIKRKNQKILINISTIDNKTNNYHKRRNYTNTEDNKCNSKESNVELKKKISELLEMNAKLTNEKAEAESKTNELKQTVSKLKTYIINNKIQDINYFKNEIKKCKNELKVSQRTIALLKEENKKLQIENENLRNANNNNSIVSIDSEKNDEIKQVKYERKEKRFTTFKKEGTLSIDPDSII